MTPIVDRLTPIIVRGDVTAARELLESLDQEELRAAKQWFSGSRRWVDELRWWDYNGDSYDAKRRTGYEAYWIVALCAVRLCGPVTAARRVPWRDLWDFMECQGEAAFVHLLWDTDRTWVEDFVDEASRVRLGGQTRRVNQNLSRVLRAVVVHHGLPCPTGPTFLAAWSAGTGRRWPGLDWLATDPLMPNLLFLFLSSGHCGSERGLPRAVAQLVAAGRVDRTELVEHVLVLVTAPQRPAALTVLAGILDCLDLRPDEIPGGLAFVLGVMATSPGSTSKMLLPRAIDLVADGDQLLELTTLVAGRPDKNQKMTLLAAVREPVLRRRVGMEPVLASLEVLGGDDDAAFAARVARARSALAPDDALGENPPATASVIGLWNMPPTPSGVDHLPRHWPRELPLPGWATVLSGGARDWEQPFVVDQSLGAMADGTFDDGRDLRAAVYDLLALGHLSVSTLTSALSDLFLGGGLGQGWPSALAVADAACGAPTRPAGLADLLRVLAGYAVEVPARHELPRHIAALAGAPGRTKTQMEARLLGANLSGRATEAAPVGGHGQRSSTGRPISSKLWTPPTRDPGPRLLSEIRVALPEQVELTRLSGLVGHQLARFEDLCGGTCLDPPHLSAQDRDLALTYPDLVLAMIVRAIHEYGGEAMRQQLAGLERQHQPRDTFAAIEIWATGRLDVASFWRLAGPSITFEETMRPWWEHQPLHGLLDSLDAPDNRPVVMPLSLRSPTSRLAFLRAAESLILAERNPIVLSTPSFADGTVNIDDLLQRLHSSGDQPVGPLDLVQALHRLRPVDGPAPFGLGLRAEVFTDPALTRRDGGERWDATDVVEHWLSQGGLRPQQPALGLDRRWWSSAVAPVPWTRCASSPLTNFRDNWWCFGPGGDSIRMFPFWGDRSVEYGFGISSYHTHFPSRMGGSFGLPLHDVLLEKLLSTAARPAELDLLRYALDHDRVDPDIAAAAAVGRHENDRLPLKRFTQVAYTLFETGDLRGLWPIALTIASALCSVDPAPPDLPDLLRLLSAYAHEVPDPHVPEGLRAFAAATGETHGHEQARQLVAALECRSVSSTRTEKPA